MIAARLVHSIDLVHLTRPESNPHGSYNLLTHQLLTPYAHLSVDPDRANVSLGLSRFLRTLRAIADIFVINVKFATTAGGRATRRAALPRQRGVTRESPSGG
jgi:hypothetical protein